MIKNLYWAWAIKNIVCVICFVVLAIVFNKWWIVFFSLLFMTSLKHRPQRFYYRICDKCGKHSEYADTVDEAIEKAKSNGWLHDKDNDKDYCPDCQQIK